jgi:hypothetical protein
MDSMLKPFPVKLAALCFPQIQQAMLRETTVMNRRQGYLLAHKVGGPPPGKVDAGGDESIVADEE